MKVAVFGAGYVGLVTGACLAELGHDVVVRDIVSDKIDSLNAGEVPIHEAGLADLLERNRERLSFTTEVGEALEVAEVVYVAVGTPPTQSGDADLTAVWTVVDELPHVDRRIVLAMKSTVPVGTGRTVRHRLDERGLENVGYASNPEFTAEGTAVSDFMHPDRIVIGAFEEADADVVEKLHAGIDAPVIRTDVNSAEMIKLAANAFLVTRISFINEIANVCEATGADVVKVAEGVGLDHRLGPHFLRAGIGYGGSCLVGEETVLVRDRSGTRLRSLEALYEATEPGEPLEILTWRPDGAGPEFLPIELLTRREYHGEIVEVRTKMGRRVQCTPDHPFVTQDGRKLAEELTHQDWVPIAQGAAPSARRPLRTLRIIEAYERMNLPPQRVWVRPREAELSSLPIREIRHAVATKSRRRGRRAGDILRSGSLTLDEAAALDIELDDAFLRTARSGLEVPASISVDKAFLRIVGLYIAEGHATVNRSRSTYGLQWCFHPYREDDLVQEVSRYWTQLGMKPVVYAAPTTKIVRVSSRLLVTWWLTELGLGRNCYAQRLPDIIWDEPDEHKWALLAGLWLGDGSWSFVSRGPNVVLEYGTVSRELADGILRLLGELGIMARVRVGRTAKSTVDTYWLVISGAEQVERCLDFVPDRDRERILASIGRQQKRIAPTGFRRYDNAAWVRVVGIERRAFSGNVYSLEVPPTHTFVTTAGVALSNCFPKDSLALKQLAANSGYSFQLLNAVIEVNELQKRRVIKKLQARLGSLRGKKIALLGLAFKPGTDDMREAPSLVLAGRLKAEGAEVSAWDPVADGQVHLDGVDVAPSALAALEGADAAVLVTEWPELRELDWEEAGRRMSNRLLVDGRNMLDPETMRKHGFEYEGIGRASE